MHRSNDRILTTHVGSLPRPPALRDLLIRDERGESIDRAEFQRQIEAAVRRVVVKQLEVGIDIGNNGEQPRVGFQTYVASRMQGFGGASARPTSMDVRAFPDYGAMLRARRSQTTKIDNAPRSPRCTIPISARQPRSAISSSNAWQSSPSPLSSLL